MDRKPPAGTKINRQHPMAKDMFFFCALDRNGDQVDLINGTVGVRDSSGSSTAELIPTPYGLAHDFEFTGADEWNGFNFGNTGGSGVLEPDALTIIARFKPEDETDGGGSRIISKRIAAGGNEDYAVYLSSDKLSMRYRINGSEDAIDPSGRGELLGATFVAALTVDSTGQDNYLWDLDLGVLDRDINQTGATVNGGTGDLCIGFRQGEDRQFDGIIHYVAMWNKKKSQAFIDAFRRNPWQIFKHQIIYVPLIPGIVSIQEGPGTTVIITDVNGDETWVDGATGLIITGTGFA